MLSSRFSFLGSKGYNKVDSSSDDVKIEHTPTIKLQTDKEVYRPGDSIFVTIEICHPYVGGTSEEIVPSLLIEKLSFELKGIEKLDTQWFSTQKPFPGSKQRRGEHVFLDGSTPSLISNHVVTSGSTRTYVVRALLPDIMPPSYRGTTIRYLYYVKSTLSGRWLILGNGNSYRESRKDITEVETRLPLQIWVAQKSNGLLMEGGQSDGIVPATTIQADIYWKEMDADSEWSRTNDVYDNVEDGYESSRDEISSVSSYNPGRESLHKNFESSLTLQSSTARSSFRDAPYQEGERTSLSSNYAHPQLAVAEVLYGSSVGDLSPGKASTDVSPDQHWRPATNVAADDTAGVSAKSGARASEPVASESFIRGRSYNIKMDDQVLLKFSPKNSDSTYYFSDMIGGTLTFFHEEGSRRCLEVSITLETSETINRRSVHPSRRHSPTVTKVQSDHHEVVADLVQTSFLFSVPMDGPMSFSTAHVSVQWVLRFEFFITPRNVDWTRYDHPLMIEGRDKNEWVLPITVHAPSPGTTAAHNRNEKSFTLEPLWVRT